MSSFRSADQSRTGVPIIATAETQEASRQKSTRILQNLYGKPTKTYREWMEILECGKIWKILALHFSDKERLFVKPRTHSRSHLGCTFCATSNPAAATGRVNPDPSLAAQRGSTPHTGTCAQHCSLNTYHGTAGHNKKLRLQTAVVLLSHWISCILAAAPHLI